jgi:N-acetylmuramoyl-L-alanine amidase
LKQLYPILIAFFFLLQADCLFAGDTFVLVIDPGHGGKDTGAPGKKSNEKDVNFAVSKLVGDYITKAHKDVKVVYTRKTDAYVDLKDRTRIANKANADLFISIHANANKKTSISGAEVYLLGLHKTETSLEVAKRENSVILMEDNYKQKYENFNPNSDESYIIFELTQNKYVEQSLRFASMVQKELVKTAKRKDRGVKQAGFWVLVGATMPRVLIELDFISNVESEKFLMSKDGQEKMARAIANAFAQYKKEYDHKKTGAGIAQDVPDKIFVETPEMEEPDESVIADDDPPKNDQSKNAPQRNDLQKNDPPKNDKDLVYKVQILASDKKLSPNSSQLKGYKADYYYEKNLYKYTYGESSDWKEISAIRRSLLKKFNDAFIVTFKEGVKVPNP